jgi:hypothetical protein
MVVDRWPIILVKGDPID